MKENSAIILSLILPFFLNGKIHALVVDNLGLPTIVMCLKDDPNRPEEPGSITTAAENSSVEAISDGSLYFLKNNLQNSSMSIRVSLVNNDSGGYESTSSYQNRYEGQGPRNGGFSLVTTLEVAVRQITIGCSGVVARGPNCVGWICERKVILI